MTIPGVDLAQAARRIAIERGFEPDFAPEVTRAAAQVTQVAPSGSDRKDLRELLWSSIDNQESRDLDQLEYADRSAGDGIRLLVAIADVDAYVPKGSVVDEHARKNTTSLYTGVVVFPMLPRELSEGVTSLLPDQDRYAVVMELVVLADGSIQQCGAFRALVRNKAKLTYEDVGAWLEGGATPPSVAAVPTLVEQLTLQREAARRLKAERQRAGALEFDTIEARPVTQGGKVVDLAVIRKNLARDLIEDFMIAANISTSKFLEKHNSSGIRRVVRRPERWNRIVDLARQHGASLPAEPDSQALAAFLAQARARDPLRFPDLSLSIVKLLGRGEYALDMPGKDKDGHFGLAADDYSHATAPNRRYADLVQQRLVKAVLDNAPQPYTNDELAAVAARCTEREDEAQRVERAMRKVIAAQLFSDRIGQTFDAIVTGASTKGTFVRLLRPPAEGRVVRGEGGMDVGDKVRVRLARVDPVRGYIDLERAP